MKNLFKEQINFVISLFVLFSLTGLSLIRMNSMGAIVQEFYSKKLRVMERSRTLQMGYRDIEFHMAAFGAGTLTAQKCLYRLRESRELIQKMTSNYLDLIQDGNDNPSVQENIIELKNGVEQSRQFFTRLESAYSNGSQAQVVNLLQSDWSTIRSQVMTPLFSLYDNNVQSADDDYEKAVQLQRESARQTQLGLAIGTLVLLLSAYRFNQLRKKHDLKLQSELSLQKELNNAQSLNIKNAKLTSLGEMSAGIAHEINNPLAIIMGSLTLISKFRDQPEKLDAKLQSVKKSAERIGKIVSGLKKFSRTGGEPNYQAHSLSKILNEALVLTEIKSKRHNVTVQVDIRTEAETLCDEVEIEQVIINLINNSVDAIQYLSERWIRVELTEQSELIILRVMDSGPGIPQEIRDKLFEPFFTTKKVGEGTGLGLSITKGILDQHGAKIRIAAEFPNTCFELQFQKKNVATNLAA